MEKIKEIIKRLSIIEKIQDTGLQSKQGKKIYYGNGNYFIKENPVRLTKIKPPMPRIVNDGTCGEED